jgi:hypothetical protein
MLKSGDDKFLGVGIEYPSVTTVDKLYTTGLTGIIDTFDSNVCTYMDTKDLSKYKYTPPSDSVDTVEKLKCKELIADIDAEISKNAGNWVVQGKLRSTMDKVKEVCTTGGIESLSDTSLIPTSEFRRNGKVSDLFCT